MIWCPRHHIYYDENRVGGCPACDLQEVLEKYADVNFYRGYWESVPMQPKALDDQGHEAREEIAKWPPVT